MGFGSLGKSANQIMIHIRGETKDLDKSLKGTNAKLKNFRKNIKDNYGELILLGGGFAAAAAAMVGYTAVVAAKSELLKRGFHSMAASQGKDADEYIQKLKEMSHNTVSEAEIMQKANQAMLLGIDLDTITKMMEGAAVIAQATGQNVGYMFESLALGVGRQSRMLLDNLGIIVKVEEANAAYADSLGITVSQLTDADKKTAFLNATMDGLAERTEALGGFTASTATEFARLKANMDDSAVAIGTNLLPALENVIGGLNIIIERSGEQTQVWKNLTEVLTAPFAVSELFGEQIRRVIDINELRKEGVDTEQEIVDRLGLHSIVLTEINDKTFQRKIDILEGMGYSERALQLEQARAYGLSMEERSLQNVVDLEKERTNEIEKQLTMRQRATRAQGRIMEREGIGGRMEDIKAGRIITAAGFKEKYGAESPYIAAQRSGIQ